MRTKKKLSLLLGALMLVCFVLASCDSGRSLTLDSAGVTLTAVGQTKQVKAFAGKNDVTARAQWSSADDSVCSVDGGLLTAVAQGATTIEAAYDGQTASLTVTIDDKGAQTTSLTLDADTATFTAVGQTKQVKAFWGQREVTAGAVWTTGKASVATVEAGLITAAGDGTTTVTVAYNGKRQEVRVTVNTVAAGDTVLSVDKTSVVIDSKTGSATVKAYRNEAVALDAEWVSDNPAVAAVEGGVITAKEWGYTTVRVSATVVEDGDTFIDTIAIPVTVRRWNDAPAVTDTFYDNFATLTSSNWNFVNYGWGQNGVSGYNGLYTANGQVVRAEQASGGIVVLPSYGRYNGDASKRGQGTCLISSDSYGPGLYETRMKIVPRFGPCSAVWPYYTNSNYGWNTAERQEYTEIDIIEIPATGRGFHAYGGVTYTKYYFESQDYTDKTPLDPQPNNLLQRTSTGVTAHASLGQDGGAYTGGAGVPSPLNDGEWHVYAAEWRTDPTTGNRGVSYLLDGKEVAFTALAPDYTAQLWIGNWFPNNAKSWLGDDDFDQAYMYVDWVRITEYDEPVHERPANLGGCIGVSAAENLLARPLPKNNYVSNGDFAVSDGANQALGWTMTNAVRKNDDTVTLASGGSISQLVSAQYNGYEFDLSVTAAASGGTVKAYVEYYRMSYGSGSSRGNFNLYGGGSNENTTARIAGGVLVGKSAELVFDSATAATKNLVFRLEPDVAGDEINNIRLVIVAADGTATITNAQMYLAKDVK